MNNKIQILAIIPARSGSKGLKNKNIKFLNGHPLLAYSIKAGLSSNNIDRVICSTDSKKIRDIARDYGADVPFIRPKKFATDQSRDFSFINHTLEWLRDNENYTPNLIIILRPTSPLRRIDDIDDSINIMINNPNYDSLRSVCETNYTPYKMWKINQNNNLLDPLLRLNYDPEPYNSPRQSLPKIYWQTGQIEIIRYSCIIDLKSVSGSKITSYQLDESISVDIDTEENFKLAEIILKSNNELVAL